MHMQNIPEESWSVTPSDTTDYTQGRAMGFQVSVTGTVQVIHKNGASPVPWYAVAGVQYACAHVRINETDTSAGTLAGSIIAFR